ncbi:hypothetical protein Pan216_20780 [Planctomycetes bacterium Pan216]|uniref:Uncharacterized protein n=2 Tax=Kolteria novifilia TaxID=2527975 RepID=A0A518B2Q9_9BACT|nr:hypothetical protein Pan216_20780 [Planctomycetes bacterium Pan216]
MTVNLPTRGTQTIQAAYVDDDDDWIYFERDSSLESSDGLHIDIQMCKHKQRTQTSVYGWEYKRASLVQVTIRDETNNQGAKFRTNQASQTIFNSTLFYGKQAYPIGDGTPLPVYLEDDCAAANRVWVGKYAIPGASSYAATRWFPTTAQKGVTVTVDTTQMDLTCHGQKTYYIGAPTASVYSGESQIVDPVWTHVEVQGNLTRTIEVRSIDNGTNGFQSGFIKYTVGRSVLSPGSSTTTWRLTCNEARDPTDPFTSEEFEFESLDLVGGSWEILCQPSGTPEVTIAEYTP